MAMILALRRGVRVRVARSSWPDLERASRAIYEAVLEASAAGVRTPDLGGHASTSGFTTEVITRVRRRSRCGRHWGRRSDLLDGGVMCAGPSAHGAAESPMPSQCQQRHSHARSTRWIASVIVAATSRLMMFSASCSAEPRNESRSP